MSEIQDAAQIIKVSFEGAEIILKMGNTGWQFVKDLCAVFKKVLDQEKPKCPGNRRKRRWKNLVHGETQSPSVKQGFPDHYRSQRGDFKMLRRYAESAWIPDTGAEPGGNGAV